jgi:hypothetical protein
MLSARHIIVSASTRRTGMADGCSRHLCTLLQPASPVLLRPQPPQRLHALSQACPHRLHQAGGAPCIGVPAVCCSVSIICLSSAVWIAVWSSLRRSSHLVSKEPVHGLALCPHLRPQRLQLPCYCFVPGCPAHASAHSDFTLQRPTTERHKVLWSNHYVMATQHVSAGRHCKGRHRTGDHWSGSAQLQRRTDVRLCPFRLPQRAPRRRAPEERLAPQRALALRRQL